MIDSKDKEKNKIANSINSYFSNLSYYAHYNSDIWITVLIIFIVLAFTIYFYILNRLQSFKSNWDKYKCNPIFMPFASIINNPTNGQHLDYILNNFNSCMDEMNNYLNAKIQSPIDSILINLKSFFALVLSVFKSIWEFIMYLIALLFEFFKYLISKLQLLSAELNILVIRVVAFVENLLSIFSVAYYELILLINTLKLIFSVLATGFWWTFVLPGIIAVSVGWVVTLLMLTLGIIFLGACFIAPPFSLWACPISAFYWTVWGIVLLATIIATIYLVLVSLIHSVMNKFAEDVLKKTLPE